VDKFIERTSVHRIKIIPLSPRRSCANHGTEVPHKSTLVLQELNAAATSTEAFGSTAKAPVCNSLLDERTRACTKRKIDDVVDPDSPSFKTKVQVHQGETRESLESGHLPVARSFTWK
jgi:hypothetical protein